MAKIILSVDGSVLKELRLSKERVTIGRRAMNDMVIDHVAISGEHAAIVTRENGVFLEDLNSTNGTQINGQSVSKHALQHNDVIDMAPYQIRFVAEPDAESVPQQPAMLTVLNGQRAGAEMALTKTLTTIGQPGVQVAVVAYRPPGYVITHVEGSVFPLVNGDSIGEKARLLKADDVIDLSGTRMVFSYPTIV